MVGVVVWDGMSYVREDSTSECKIRVGWCGVSATVYDGVCYVRIRPANVRMGR